MADREAEQKGWAGEVARHASGDERQDLAEARTQMAEDRTVLANERTFASWMRTGLASVGIGLGFQALFLSMQPWWLPRAIATSFFLVGIFVTLSAQRRACTVFQRLHTHEVRSVGVRRVQTISWAISLAIAALIAGLWTLPIG